MSDQGVDAGIGAEPGELGERAARFAALRPTLLGAAYRILSSYTDAEDVVQEVWLRWVDVDPASVRDERAYLLTMTTRQALNWVRSAQRRREDYVGPWLPEPVATDLAGDGAAHAELVDDVSMALLVVLETLSPLERAAFVLGEVFGMPAADVGAALDRRPDTVRQLQRRARSHVQARAPRHQPERQELEQAVARFLFASATGDLGTLLEVLAPDVELVTDGGGIKRAALRPIVGAEKVARWFVGILSKPESASFVPAVRVINGTPAVVVQDGADVDAVLFVTLNDDGRIATMHQVRNPEKLHWV